MRFLFKAISVWGFSNLHLTISACISPFSVVENTGIAVYYKYRNSSSFLPAMSSTIEIHNLPQNVSENDIRSLFMTFGEIEKIIIRREKSRSFNSSSTVFANVRFEIAQDAKEAIYNMNGYSYFNKLLIVKNLDEKIFQDRLKNSTNTKTAIWNQDTEDLDNATGDQIE